MAGLEIADQDGRPQTEIAVKLIKKLLHRGYIFLPEGEHSNVISFTPPLTITQAQLARSIRALQEEIERL